MKKFFAVPFCALIFFTFLSFEAEASSIVDENPLNTERVNFLDNGKLEEDNTVTPYMMSARVRNTFWQQQYDNGRWSDPYSVTYRDIMFRYNFKKTGTNQIYNSGGLFPKIQFQDIYSIN